MAVSLSPIPGECLPESMERGGQVIMPEKARFVYRCLMDIPPFQKGRNQLQTPQKVWTPRILLQCVVVRCMNVRFCALRMLWCELERGQGAAGREPNGTSQWKTVNAPTQATEGTENNQQTNNSDPPTDYTETNTHIHRHRPPFVFLW
jgi:hypothetical protein